MPNPIHAVIRFRIGTTMYQCNNLSSDEFNAFKIKAASDTFAYLQENAQGKFIVYMSQHSLSHFGI